MGRILFAALHTFLAATLVLGGGVLLVQSQLNLHWELGFYRGASWLTTLLLVSAALMVSVGVVQALSSFGYALGYRWGAWGLCMVSAALMLGTPSPLRWVLALGAVALLLELWATRYRPASAAADDE